MTVTAQSHGGSCGILWAATVTFATVNTDREEYSFYEFLSVLFPICVNKRGSMGIQGVDSGSTASKRCLPPKNPLKRVYPTRRRIDPVPSTLYIPDEPQNHCRYCPFTRVTISRMTFSKLGSAALNSVPLMTSGAPKTTISAPIASV